jgi:putative FmdB family regulatory protein
MTYEYVCTACGHAWEAEQSISAGPLKTCPHCHTDHAKRQISRGAGFILKGGGWYADGYGSSKANAGGSSSSMSPGSSESSSPSEAKSEAKTEPKTEPKTDTKTETPKATTGTPS